MDDAAPEPARLRPAKRLPAAMLRAFVSRRVWPWAVLLVAVFALSPAAIKPAVGALVATSGGILLARAAGADLKKRSADAPAAPVLLPFSFDAGVRFPPNIGRGRWITARLVFDVEGLRWTRFWSTHRRWTRVPLAPPLTISKSSVGPLNPELYRAYLIASEGKPVAEIRVKGFDPEPVERALRSIERQ